MTNVYILLLIGGALGWGVSALLPTLSSRQATFLVALGAVSSFAAGLMANGGMVFGTLRQDSISMALAASLITLGLGIAAMRAPKN